MASGPPPPRIPAQVSRLQACLGQHGTASQSEHEFIFEYRHVMVEIYPSAVAAEVSMRPDPRNPGLDTRIRTKNVIVSIGDAIVGGEQQDAARVRKCVR